MKHIEEVARVLRKHQVPRSRALGILLESVRPDQVLDARIAIWNEYGEDASEPGGGGPESFPAVDEAGGSLLPWSWP